MNKYLPSKQFIKIIGSSLLFGVVLIVGGRLIGTKKVWSNNPEPSVVVQNTQDDFFSKDSDGDGLYDWEEALWGTNPHMADSRGDGISDYDYVKNLRQKIDVDDSYTSSSSNQTQTFAKQFYTTAAVINQTGGLNQETLDKFSQNIGSTLNNFRIEDKYTVADIKTSSISIDQYRTNIDNLYDGLGSLDIEETMLIGFIIQNPEDEYALEVLGEYLNYSEKLVLGLLSMNVPHGNLGPHLAFVNNIDKMAEIVKSTVFVNDDPLKTLTYLSKYEIYADHLENSQNMMNRYLSSGGGI